MANSNNTAQKQVNDMKRTVILSLSLSLLTLASVVITRAIDEPRQAELRARFHGCDTNPYSCVPPTITLASLR